MKTQITKYVKVAAVGMLAAFTMTACGSKTPSIFKDAKFNTYKNGVDLHATLQTDISSENVIFTGITLPVHHKGEVLGSVTIATDLATQKTSMLLDINMSQLVNVPLPEMAATLPNGTAWPIADVDQNKMMSFDVGNGSSRAYVYYDSINKKVLMGAAINVDGLSIGTPANLFWMFDANNVTGLVGMYFGAAAEQSGVAFIGDVSKAFYGASSSPGAVFAPMSLSNKQSEKVYKKLNKLNNSKARVNLQ